MSNLGNFEKELKTPAYNFEEKPYYCFFVMNTKGTSASMQGPPVAGKQNLVCGLKITSRSKLTI